MKYLTLLLFLLGGFLSQVEGQTILDYSTYVSGLQNSSDPFQNSEAERIVKFATGLYPTAYFSETGLNVIGGKRCKKIVANVENLNLQGYDEDMLHDVEMVIILVRKQELISSGQISQDLYSLMPNLKNVLFIAEFPSVPSDFTTILTPNTSGYVPLHKVSITE